MTLNTFKLNQNYNRLKFIGYIENPENLLIYRKWLYVPNLNSQKQMVLDEYHKKQYAVNQGYQNMVTTLRNDSVWSI